MPLEWLRDLSIFLTVSVGIFAFISMLAGAVASIIKFFRWIRKPADDANSDLEQYKIEAAAEHQRLQEAIMVNQKAIERISESFEEENKKIYTFLGKDKERMDKYDANFRILYRGMLALLDQQLNPNGKLEQMKKTRDDLESHIIDN